MSMEAMKTLAQAEAAAATRIKASQEAGEGQLAEATRMAAAQREEHRAAAEVEAKALMTAAEEKAAGSTQKILAEAEANCTKMKRDAQGRLEKAAARIAERVVNI